MRNEKFEMGPVLVWFPPKIEPEALIFFNGHFWQEVIPESGLEKTGRTTSRNQKSNTSKIIPATLYPLGTPTHQTF